jgi:DNA modification methylase
MEINKIYNIDCMDGFKFIEDNSINLILTDIPYDSVNRPSNGLRNLDKKDADVLKFDLHDFLEECWRTCKGTIIIFCGTPQISPIYEFFREKQTTSHGTIRHIVWEKSNPSPMNGQHIYLSGIEDAIWFKKVGGTFNAHCKNTVFKFPCGRSKLHPTEKNHQLLKQLLIENSNEGDLILDPCFGGGSHLFVAKENNRNYIGFELSPEYFKIGETLLT